MTLLQDSSSPEESGPSFRTSCVEGHTSASTIPVTGNATSHSPPAPSTTQRSLTPPPSFYLSPARFPYSTRAQTPLTTSGVNTTAASIRQPLSPSPHINRRSTPVADSDLELPRISAISPAFRFPSIGSSPPTSHSLPFPDTPAQHSPSPLRPIRSSEPSASTVSTVRPIKDWMPVEEEHRGWWQGMFKVMEDSGLGDPFTDVLDLCYVHEEAMGFKVRLQYSY